MTRKCFVQYLVMEHMMKYGESASTAIKAANWKADELEDIDPTFFDHSHPHRKPAATPVPDPIVQPDVETGPLERLAALFKGWCR